MRAARRVNATASPTPARRPARLLAEMLEKRMMLSANNPLALIATPNVTPFAASSIHTYSPAQIRHAYGFDQLSLTGAGQTIAIVDAYDAPTIAADLHKFDTQFGLSDPKLTVYKQTKNGQAPKYDSGWAMEIALDVEWAHAIAPAANILLVEANTASLSDLLAAVDYARKQPGVSVVSMSWGAGEFSSEGMFDSYFTTPAGHAGVTFVASSGDSGAPASWPSISSNVVAVGGTNLSLNASNGYAGEKGWGGSGGGYSPFLPEPTYQRGFQSTGHRSNPDVAYDADPSSGFYVYTGGGWYAVGGTSAGAPQWAALFALANQGRALAGRAALTSSLQALYSFSGADFHDVTTGNNGYAAGAGYDPVTGRGSPVANLLVADLINYGATSSATSAKPTTGTVSSTAGKHALRATDDALLSSIVTTSAPASASGANATSTVASLSGALSIAAANTAAVVDSASTTQFSFGQATKSEFQADDFAPTSDKSDADQAAAADQAIVDHTTVEQAAADSGSDVSLLIGDDSGSLTDSRTLRDTIDAILADDGWQMNDDSAAATNEAPAEQTSATDRAEAVESPAEVAA